MRLARRVCWAGERGTWGTGHGTHFKLCFDVAMGNVEAAELCCKLCHLAGSLGEGKGGG